MSAPAPMRAWLAAPLPSDVETMLERLCRADDVQRVAVMPDVHLAEGVCVGTVVATEGLLYPQAVGQDIGCGMAAVRFDGPASLLDGAAAAAAVLDGLARAVPALKHGRGTRWTELPPPLEQEPLSDSGLERTRRRDGRLQFGTLGRGNHFLELQRDEAGSLWLMLHSGSRALGRAIYDHHLARAVAGRSGLAALPADRPEGEAFLADVAVALRYAEESRRAMVEAAAAVVGRVLGLRPDATPWITCHHNHVRKERHEGRELLVHRKGAIPAAAGVPGIIPGSMGSPSFHVEGRGAPGSLDSSAHGAGRAMSRAEARRRIGLKELRRQMGRVWYDHRLAARLVDEAPGAYKDVGAVMRAQRELTRIVRRLEPVLSSKGADCGA